MKKSIIQTTDPLDGMKERARNFVRDALGMLLQKGKTKEEFAVAIDAVGIILIVVEC